MIKVSATCNEAKLVPTEGSGYALEVTITSVGDEALPVSGVFLCRKGINLLPEFADGFGFDASDVIQGLAPEEYQFRIQMLLSHKGGLLYRDGKSEFRLAPSKSVRFLLPIPFQGMGYFLQAPAEDLFVAVSSLNGQEQVLELPSLQATMCTSVNEHGHLGRPYNTYISIKVPQKSPLSQDLMRKLVGRVNERPIRPMPNT